jgi:hypothetical protein
MGSRNDEPFVGGESRLDYLSVHMQNPWLKIVQLVRVTRETWL